MSLLLATAAVDVLRRANYRGGRRTVLLEQADPNLCPRSEDLSTWTKSSGTGSATGSLGDPAGGTTAYKLDDQDAVVDVNWSSPQFAAYSGAWTTRGFSHFFKADTAAVCEIGVHDITAATYRARLSLTPSAGVLTAAGAVFNTGTGRVIAVLPVTDQPGHYRVLFEVDNIVVANNHRFIVRPAGPTGTALGASILWGFHAHNSCSPGRSYYPNATAGSSVTPGADILRLPYLQVPGAVTFYARYYENGAQRRALVEAASPRVIQLGNIANIDPRLILYFAGSTDQPRMLHSNPATGADKTSIMSGFPALVFGDLVELVGWLFQDGSVQCAASVNGGAAIYSVRTSGGKALPAAWAADGLLTSQYVQPFASVSGSAEVERVAVLPGTFTLDEVRGLVR